ncbi:MAG: alkaline phosphatase [Paludibacteraceae bacterium]|jgi:alkaline phosphatase|nr:alkaline phosphatase [Paludibacteraceae bacterium]
MKTVKITLVAFVAFVLLVGCAEQKPKNVIYLIGDGMGFGAVSSLLLSENGETGFEMAPVIGLNETCSANNYVTDSPAGGTALATGTRTCNGFLGVGPDSVQLESILKKAQKMGKKTGIVVNTTLTEATPGAFYAGVTSRKESYKIAEQFTESGVDVAIGAGLSAFINRPDSVDMTAVLIEKGYDVYLDWKSVLDTESEKFVGILDMGDVHRRNKSRNTTASAAEGAEVCLAAKLAASEGKVDTTRFSEPTEYLHKACNKALSVLEKDAPNGFFLMIESAIIDGYGHNNDSEGMIEEMKEFDQTLKTLIAYVNKHPNTLLVVTADHETGGTGVTYKSHAINQPEGLHLNFSTKGHTGTVVPIFAYGAGAAKFSGIFQNRELPEMIEELIK